MKCPFCGKENTRVIDSRPADEGCSIRRRRQCDECGKRFTTYEVIENTPVLVVKNDGTRQTFDVNKLKNGIIKSCEKRPVAISDIEKLVNEIEKKVYNNLDQEISSAQIGEMVMQGLKNLDEVAYIRFASVYRQFRDVTTFADFINEFGSKEKK